jgi:sporulation protein YlmC with PRC-barrel domain/CBS domain-containing protein
MTKHANLRTSVSAMVGSSVEDAQGRLLGRVKEVVVSPEVDANRVFGLILRLKVAGRGDHASLVTVDELQLSDGGALRLKQGATPGKLPENDTFLLLERDVLDQQIIDVNGHKVVRVNDVDLVWEETHESGPDLLLRVAEVEVGTRGAVRRLLKGLPEATVDRIACRFKASIIPWDFVDLIDRDPSRTVKLKIQQDRLSKMHPSDIADILEELAPAERQALFISLDEEVAAEALEEIQPRLQQSLLESMDSERVAGIVEEMDPGAAADLLSELPDERSEAILGEMDPEERLEVEELLEFSGDSAAGRMTPDYIALPEDAVMSHALTGLREYEGDIENVTEIYLVDAEDKIMAIIPLVQLLLAAPDVPLIDLPHAHLLSCEENANGRKVAELFDKYNLRSLPVIDHAKRLIGVIHAEQVIALLRSKH